jgi:hypothetical protein
LTDDDIVKIAEDYYGDIDALILYARAIERAHGIGE